MPLSGNRVLVILVINEREVQNRVVHTSRKFSDIELQQAAVMINQRYAGQSLSDIRCGVVVAMEEDKNSIDNYMQATLDLASKAFETEEEVGTDYVVAGENQLVNMSSPEDMEHLQELFEAFERKKISSNW